MILFRTYLEDLDTWHTWPVDDDPAEAAARLDAWARGSPHQRTSGGFSIPWRGPIPTGVIRWDPAWAAAKAAKRLPYAEPLTR